MPPLRSLKSAWEVVGDDFVRCRDVRHDTPTREAVSNDPIKHALCQSLKAPSTQEVVGAGVVGDGIGAHGWGNQLARKTALSYFRSRGTGTCGHDGTHNLVYGQQILVPEHLVEQKTPEIAHHLGLHRSTSCIVQSFSLNCTPIVTTQISSKTFHEQSR